MKLARFLILTIMLTAVVLPMTACQDIASPVESFNWALTQYGTLTNPKTPLPDTEITAYFDGKTKTVYGSSGCNTYGGNYTVDHLTLVINGSISMTEIACPGEKGTQENEYIKELKNCDGFEMDHGKLIIHSGVNRLKFKQNDKAIKTVTHWGE